MNKTFKKVGSLHPSVNRFNLSFDRTFDADFGELIPVLGEEMVPGQSIRLSLESVIRMQPTVAPILHEIDVFCHFFFVPNRILMDDVDHGWERFLTGGVSGDEEVGLPVWQFGGSVLNRMASKYSLADYFDIPVGVAIPEEDVPIGFLQRAYNLIYNEYYRDQNYMEEVSRWNNNILNRCWEKDYFTSALPMQQRGTSPAFPVTGVLPVDFVGGSSLIFPPTSGLDDLNSIGNPVVFDGSNDSYVMRMPTQLYLQARDGALKMGGKAKSITPGSFSPVENSFNEVSITGSIDLGNAVTFDVSDMRFAFQVQKWMERNMRAGVRYTEFLKAHFGVSPTDSRLQRPEYVGGCKSHVIVSEVAQTSATDSVSPQGNLAGRGLVADFNKITKFVSPEYGYLVGIMSIMPKSKYFQGLDKKMSRKSRFDWLMPEFVNLSEQPVLNKEIYLSSNTNDNNGNFGYQGIYNEMRSHQSKVNGALRDTLDYWHLGRKFANLPVLNADFLECDAERDGLKRIFAVQDEKGFICNLGFHIRSLLPLPVIAEPGLIDHH